MKVMMMTMVVMMMMTLTECTRCAQYTRCVLGALSVLGAYSVRSVPSSFLGLPFTPLCLHTSGYPPCFRRFVHPFRSLYVPVSSFLCEPPSVYLLFCAPPPRYPPKSAASAARPLQ